MRDATDYAHCVPHEQRHNRYIHFPLEEVPVKPKKDPIQWKDWFQSSVPVVDAKRIYHKTIRVPVTQILIIFVFCILSVIMVWNIVNLRNTHKQYEYLANSYNTVVEENNRLNQIFFESYDKEYLYGIVEAYELIAIEDAERYIIDVENKQTIHDVK